MKKHNRGTVVLNSYAVGFSVEHKLRNSIRIFMQLNENIIKEKHHNSTIKVVHIRFILRLLKTYDSFVWGRDWNLCCYSLIILPTGKVLKSHLVWLELRFLRHSIISQSKAYEWEWDFRALAEGIWFWILRAMIIMNSCMKVLQKKLNKNFPTEK